MDESITASMSHDLVQRPHRVGVDLFGDSKQRDAISQFVQLWWERGQQFEQDVIAKLAVPFYQPPLLFRAGKSTVDP